MADPVINKGVPHVCREMPDIPLVPPPTGPMIEFLNENDCCTSKTAQWPELMRKLDDCMLWQKVGGVFNQLGIAHPFDPEDMPDETKAQLASLKEYYGGDNISCEDVAYIIEDSLEQDQLCISQGGELEFPIELTSCESLKRCIDGQDPGTCSEQAYKTASEMLYLNPSRPMRIAIWPNHIEVASAHGEQAGYNAQVLGIGPPLYVTDKPSELLATYYNALFIKEAKGGNPARALEISRFAASLLPDNPKVLYALAHALIKNRLFIFAEAAATRLKEVGALYYHYEISALLRYHEGNFDKEIELIDNMAYMHPWDMSVYVIKAHHLLYTFTSLEQLRRASQLNAEASSIMLAEGDIPGDEENIDRFDRIMKEMISFLTLPNPSPMELYKLACLYFVKGETAKAEEIAGPNIMKNEDFFGLMANIYEDEGRWDDIIELAKNYLDKNPTSPLAKHTLAQTYLELGRDNEARELYVELTTSNEPKYRGIAYSELYYLNDPDAPNALSDLELAQKALDANPTESQNYFMLAEIIMGKTGDEKKALQLVEAGRRIDPFAVYAYIVLGDIYSYSCQPEKAFMWYRLPNILFNNDKFNAEEIGQTLLAMGDNVAAKKWFETALGDDISATSLTGMIIALYEENDPRYKFYLRELLFLQDLSVYTDLYYMLGRMAEKDGNSESATRYYQLTVSIMPGFGEAKKRLIALGGIPQSAELTASDELLAIEDVRKRSE